jgi:hypothetical protein
MRAPDHLCVGVLDRPDHGRPHSSSVVLVSLLCFAVCSGCSSGKGLRKGIPDATVELQECVPGASECSCPSGQPGVRICTSAGTFLPCQCAPPDGADIMEGDSAVGSDSATRMDATPDGPDTMGGDSAIESNSAANTDASGAPSCYDLTRAASNGLDRVGDSSCQSDADCAIVGVEGKCLDYCFVARNVASVAAVEAAEDQLCEPFFAQKCESWHTPCPAASSKCVGGACFIEWGGKPGG